MEAATAKERYQLAAKRCEELLAGLDRRGAHLANARVVAFVGAIAAAAATVLGKLPLWGYALAVLLLLVYAVLAGIHGRVIEAEEKERIRLGLERRGLSRLAGEWHGFAERGEIYLPEGHPNAPDLDLFGQGSLFQLLDETATRAGERRLADWLLGPAQRETVRARQEAVRELAKGFDFRQALAVEARHAAEKKADPAAFLAWAEKAPTLASVRWAIPLAWILPLVTATLFALSGARVIGPAFGWLGLLAQLLVVAATRGPLGEYYRAISAGELGFGRFERAFLVIDQARFSSPLLAELAGARAKGAYGPLRAFARRFSFAELRQSGQMHAVINLLLLWDVHWLFALERWRVAHGSSARRWFDALAELEALGCLATFAFERPSFVFPELVEGGPRFEALALGHPLLESPVRNDVTLRGPGEALLVTGSNMSGKTTLLRAMGANAVLAQMGAPVSAERLTLSSLEVLTSMRVKDSLERGVSYFYAEVQRLKMLLDRAKAAEGRALFLLDEILLGTNTRERQIASREVVRLLLATGAIGAVSTHDLTLATLEQESGGKVRNVHFRDQLEGEKMSFDYRLRQGVVDTTNALRVLKLAGIPVRE